MKDKDDIRYCPQVLIEQFVYKAFSNNTIIHLDIAFRDTEPDESDESEEEINEKPVFD